MGKSFWGFILLALLSAPASSGELELLLGGSYNAQEGATPTGWLQYAAAPRERRGYWQPQFVLAAGGIAARDAPGYSSQVLLGGGVRLRRMSQSGIPSPWFAEGMLLGNSKSTPALSGHFQFGSALGYGRGRYQVVVRHISNAGLRAPNGGETMLLLGVVF